MLALKDLIIESFLPFTRTNALAQSRTRITFPRDRSRTSDLTTFSILELNY
jgi:hypothetical protein